VYRNAANKEPHLESTPYDDDYITQALRSAGPVVMPKSRPLGRPFQPTIEAELLPGVVLAAVRSARSDRRLIVVPELRGPFGVADVGILETVDGVLAARLELGIVPLLNQLDAAIVSSLHTSRPLQLSSVSRTLGWPEQHLVRRIEGLRRRGAVLQLGSGSYLRPAALMPLGHLAVYEIKVNDWRRGLDQATTYAIWADSATLALTRLPRNSGAVLGLAESRRVGVITDGVWRRRAERQRLAPSVRLWASEFVVASLLYHPSAAA
jgi:hypothetical protein